MNILIITDYYPPDKLGGVGEIAKNLKRAYESCGHRTTVLTTGEKRKTESSQGVIRSNKQLIPGVFWNNIIALRMIMKGEVDVIHLHQSVTTLFLLCKPFFRRFLFVINSFQVSYFSEFQEVRSVTLEGRTFRPRFNEYVEKFLFAPVHIVLDFIGYVLSDIVTVVSNPGRDEFSNTYGKVCRKSVQVIPNGVNPLEFNLSDALEAYPNLQEKISGKVVLTYIGVFRVRKRVFNLLYALREVLKQHTQVVLLLVGGGRGYEMQIRDLAEELGVEDHVVFVGKVPNEHIPQLLKLTDVFCLLSAYEGMPVAILEAMSMGKAVLSSEVSGAKDLIQNGENGILTPVDDIQAIAQALEGLVSNRDCRQRLGNQARKDIVKKYSWNVIAKKYLDLLPAR